MIIPAWVMALGCYAAMVAALWRSRLDRRVDGYIGHALALLWLGTVYLAAALGGLGLTEAHAGSAAIRAPVLLLVMTVGLVHFLAARHAGGRRSG